MTVEQARECFAKIKKELTDVSDDGRRCFLFVYCSGYGVDRKGKHILLNSNKGVLFNVE